MDRVKVGLDGRALTNVNRNRGIGRYTARLIENLLRVESGFHFVVFGHGDGPPSDMLDPDVMKNLDWRRVHAAVGLPFHDLHADHLLFARAVEREGVSMFHGIDHNLSPFLSCPTLVTVHDLILLILRGPYLGPRSLLWMRIHRRSARKAVIVATDSESTKRDVQRIWKIPGGRVRVVYAGVEEHYSPVEDGSIIDTVLGKYGIEKPYFLATGGFDYRKNAGIMLLAFQKFLRETGGDFQFVLVGDPGRFEGYLRDQITDLGLDGRAILTGLVPHEDLPPLYSGAVALAYASLYEGFGLPPLESMACGTPVLTSNVSSIPEIVGDAGLYVDPLDPSEIAAAMRRIVEDEALRRTLAEKGRDRSRLFTWERTASEVIDLYRLILKGGG